MTALDAFAHGVITHGFDLHAARAESEKLMHRTG
jgi:hypothetical protein